MLSFTCKQHLYEVALQGRLRLKAVDVQTMFPPPSLSSNRDRLRSLVLEGQFLRQQALSQARSRIREAVITEQRILIQDMRSMQKGGSFPGSEKVEAIPSLTEKDDGHIVNHARDPSNTEQSGQGEELSDILNTDAQSGDSGPGHMCSLRLRGKASFCFTRKFVHTCRAKLAVVIHNTSEE